MTEAVDAVDDGDVSVALDGGSNAVRVTLYLRDPDIYRVLEEVDKEARPEFAVRAFKVGVLALRDAKTVGKADYVAKEFDRMQSEFDARMEQMFGSDGQVTQRIEHVFGEDGQVDQRLKRFFGDDGRFENAMDDFLGEDGKLERAVEEAVGEQGHLEKTLDDFFGEDGRLRRELDKEFGEDGGRLYRILNPNDESTPLGQFRQELEKRFDPDREGSALWTLRNDMKEQFQEIKKGLEIEEVREEEREKGHLKGLDFEELALEVVEETAQPHGDRVDHTGREAGPLGDVGDIVSTLNTGGTGGRERRIAFEVKDTDITLSGKSSIYKELDDAMQNRDAHFGVAIVETDHADRFAPLRFAAPNHLLVALDKEEPDPLPLEVGYRFARMLLSARASREDVDIDPEVLQGKLNDIESQLENVQAMKRNLTSAANKIDGVKDALDAMREQILDAVDDLSREIRDGTPDDAGQA